MKGNFSEREDRAKSRCIYGKIRMNAFRSCRFWRRGWVPHYEPQCTAYRLTICPHKLPY